MAEEIKNVRDLGDVKVGTIEVATAITGAGASTVVISDDIHNIITLTQVEYDALSPTYDADTLYIIVAVGL